MSKALWVLELKISTQSNFQEFLTSREGQGSPTAHCGFGMAVADLRISHWSPKSTFHKVWKPLLCRVSPHQALENHLFSLLFYKELSYSSKGRRALWLSVPCLMSRKFLHLLNSLNTPPAMLFIWDQATQNNLWSNCRYFHSIIYALLPANHGNKAKFSKAPRLQGGNLRGENTGNHHLKILCHEQSLPLSVLLHPEYKNVANCLAIFNDASKINVL